MCFLFGSCNDKEWLQGAHSSVDERGIIAWHTIKKDEELQGAAIHVRLVQSKEDPQFLMIFKGRMIIFKGGYASSFDGMILLLFF